MSQEEKSDSVESIIEEDTGTSTRMKSIFVVFVTGNMLMVNYGTSVINAAIVSGCLHKYEQTYKKSDLTVWIRGNVRNAAIAALVEITVIEMTTIVYWAFLTLSWSWKIVLLDKVHFSKFVFFFFMYCKSLYKVFILLSGKAITFSKSTVETKK